MSTAKDVESALKAHASAEDAIFLQRFFKTGEGQYGAGDIFIGVRVPSTRAVCRQYGDISLGEIDKLLGSPIHECRLAAVILLVGVYQKASEDERGRIYKQYLAAVDKGFVNNWDIVDTSAEFIVGEYLWQRPRDALFALAESANVWHRRVAVLATFQFIKKGDPSTTLELAKKLLNDPHDLIQKAVGWMLREIGKRIDQSLLLDFLERHYKTMPRTTLRYAIEHLPMAKRAYFMKKP